MKTEELKIIENTHEAIINKDTFDIVSNIRARKRKNTKLGYVPKLAGKLYCSDCSEVLYYVCPREKYHNSAYFFAVVIESIDANILTQLEKLI